MKSKSPLKELTLKELKHLAKFCLTYCKNTFGVNKRKRTELEVHVIDSCFFDEKACGWYDPTDNELYIILKHCKTVGDFTSTFIHEYTHYLQPCLTKYNKLLDQHGYVNHPFEIEAYKTEKIYNRKLLFEYRKTLKK